MPTDDELKAKIVDNAELAESLCGVAAWLESLGRLTGDPIGLVVDTIRLAAQRLESTPQPPSAESKGLDRSWCFECADWHEGRIKNLCIRAQHQQAARIRELEAIAERMENREHKRLGDVLAAVEAFDAEYAAYRQKHGGK